MTQDNTVRRRAISPPQKKKPRTSRVGLLSKQEARARRLDWMLDNPHLWERLGIGTMDADSRMSLVNYMKAADLVAKSTYWKDVDVPGYVIAAHKLKIERARK